jgi:CHAT domain-containing protein/tetratricopeptide (TPR) repeat protein
VVRESIIRIILVAVFLLLETEFVLSADKLLAQGRPLGQVADSLCATGDKVQLDSAVMNARFPAYRFAREILERYFDSGDEQTLQIAGCVAAAIDRNFGDRFHLRQVAKYQVWRKHLLERRSEAKRRFSEAIRSLGTNANDSLAGLFDSIARNFLELGDSAAAVRAQQYSGSVLSQPAGDKRAMQMLLLSLSIARSIGDLDGVARSLNLIGDACQKSGYTLRAGAYFDSARVIRTMLEDDKGLADCLSNISVVYLSLDQLAESYRFAAEALRIRHQIGDTLQICESVLNMISAFRHDRPPDEVEGWLEEARVLIKTLDDQVLQVRLLQAEGMSAEENGEIDSAIAYYDSALAMQATGDNARLAVSLLTNLAILRSSQGNYEGALRCYVQALDCSQRAANRGALASVLHNIGTVYQRLGDAAAAVTYFQRSLDIRRQLALPNEMVETLSSLGEIYVTANDLPMAAEYFQQAADIARAYDNPRLVANALVAQAQLDQRSGDHQAAMAKLDSTMAIYQRQSDAQRVFDVQIIRTNYARLSCDFARANEYLASAKQLLQSRRTYANIQRCEIEAGMIWYDRGELDTAYTYLARVVGRLEQSRRNIPDLELRAFQKGSNRYLYEKLVAIFASKYRQSQQRALLDSLVRYVELAKSRSLLEALDRLPGDAVSRVPAGLRRQERRVLAEIERTENEFNDSLPPTKRDALQKQIVELEGRLIDVRLRQSLVDSHSDGRFQPQPPSLKILKERLSDGHTAVLDFLLAPEHSLLIVITGDGAFLYELPSRERLTAQFADYSALLQRSATGESLIDSLRGAANALAKTLFGPFIDKLSRFDRLYVAADGALSLLPFEALVCGDKYVIEHSQVAYVPSLQLLTSVSKAPTSEQPRLLIIADPQSNDKLRPLPYSLKEAQWITELFPADRCSTLTGRNAARSVLMAPDISQYNIIHFATHSTVNRDDPLRSRIWLSPDTSADSSDYLSLRDVTQLSLSADLVVLSSCESGGGRFQLGEGIEGFVRGFMSAGCRNVVVSFWDVEDFASAVFMKEFYRNLRSGYASALQQAKLSMINSPRLRLRHPFYWAPFVIVEGN